MVALATFVPRRGEVRDGSNAASPERDEAACDLFS
jgi:hypothetical protein